MRQNNPYIERLRITRGPRATTAAAGYNATFKLPVETHTLVIVSSIGLGWEHVSVSHPSRVPNWSEMCLVKDLFWDEEEEVIQYHPRRSEYIQNHPRCLHLWRPTGQDLPRPPVILI